MIMPSCLAAFRGVAGAAAGDVGAVAAEEVGLAPAVAAAVAVAGGVAVVVVMMTEEAAIQGVQPLRRNPRNCTNPTSALATACSL